MKRPLNVCYGWWSIKNRVVKTIALLLTGAAAVSAFATSHELVFTEDSTGLSATYDGVSLSVSHFVDPNLPEGFQVFLPIPAPTSQFVLWLEPENPNKSNFVRFEGNFGSVTVISEHPLVTELAHPDGATINIGRDPRDNQPISVTFHDNDETGFSIPDTGTTLGLMCMAFFAFLGAARLRRLRCS